MTSNNDEESYWLIYIKNEFANNLNLYAEFIISNCDEVYFEYDVTFKSGYKLKSIQKNVLLQYIKKYINSTFTNPQYFISTRAKGDSSKYYIVVSIIQNNPIQTIACNVNSNSNPIIANLVDNVKK